MTRPERPILVALGLAVGLTVAADPTPAAANGGVGAVQVFPYGAAVGDPQGLAFPGARPPQSRLLVPAPPGSPSFVEPAAPRRTEAPTPRRAAPVAVATPKPAAPPSPEPEAAPAGESATVAATPPAPTPQPEPEPAVEPTAEPAQAADMPADEPPPLGPDVAPQDDLVARERLEPDAPPPEVGEMPPPVVPTDVAPPEPPVEEAAVPPSIDMLTVPFPPELSEPAGDVSAQVADLVRLLEANPDARLRLNAYAPGGPSEESKSRRLSLARALALRSQLVEAGISSTRIEVRALGNKVPDGSADRVDVIVLER